MGIADLDSIAPAITAGVAAAGVGVLTGRRLVEQGMAQLRVTHTRAALAGRVACGVAGAVAVLAAHHAGTWWLVPGLLIWAYTLAGAATCDALTQRVPTPLVRVGTIATGLSVLAAAAADDHWQWPILAALSAVAAGAIFIVCWRFLDAGFGDVRLAVLGGLGLVDPTRFGLVVGVTAFIVITLGQATVTRIRGGNRRTTIPYGPAMAITFFIIATV